MNCDERHDALLLYAAGSLDGGERDGLRAHLESGCPQCAGSLAEAEAILNQLPVALDPVEPPPSVREGLMARVAAATTPSAAAVPEPQRRPGLFDVWLRPALAAAMAVVVTYLAVSVPAERRQQALELRLASQAAELQRLEERFDAAVRRVNLVMNPAVRVVELAGTEAQPAALARIYWDRTENTWTFSAAELDSPGPGKTYQLWFITPEQEKISAGTFDVDASGRGSLEVRIPEGLDAIALAAVTDEPMGGSPQPTGSIHLVGNVDPAS